MVAVTAGASREVIRVTGTGLEAQAAWLAPAGLPPSRQAGRYDVQPRCLYVLVK